MSQTNDSIGTGTSAFVPPETIDQAHERLGHTAMRSPPPTIEALDAIMARDTCEAPKLRVALSSGAADCLRCLFFHGPTWDGNVPSKQGRDELVLMGFAARGNGWQWLTRAGVDASFDNNLHREKEAREARAARRRNEQYELARSIVGRVDER